jgi:hypothetical protein
MGFSGVSCPNDIFLLALGGEVAFPAWTEVNVPAPELALHRIGLSLVVSPELAVFAIMCHVKYPKLF